MLIPRTFHLVALVCLVAVAGCGGHQTSTAPGLVPWTDTRVETGELAQAVTSPSCRASDLRLPRSQQRWGGVWNDAVSGYLMIENSGPRACDLPPPSRVTAVRQTGSPIAFDVGRLAAPAVTLHPGDRVQLQVSSPYGCGKPLARSTGFTLTFPTGTLQVRGARMAVQCGGSLVDFSARDGSASGAGTTSTSPVSRLQVRMSRVPETVAPGRSVSYAVTLTNPTSTAITFDQCPSYQEGIKGRPSSVQTYQLNCGAVRRIDAHASVGFAMQLPLPPRLPSGEAVLDWRLQAPAQTVDEGQFASAATQVR